MLFFVKSNLQRRATNMQRQMELWPVLPEQSRPPVIWETLDHQLQKDIITALANLISKMVHSEGMNLTQEVSHER